MNGELENAGKLLIYQNEKGDTKIDVYFADESIWMTQNALAELYQVTKSTISGHILKIYKERELDENQTVRYRRTVQEEGGHAVSRDIRYYNLDMILAIGYRVQSHVGYHFRNWASGVLKEYMKKGFALNDERLRNPQEFGADYFDELLERIRDIRASEKRFYQKVRDIFALSVDYDRKSDAARVFFRTAQNKLVYAATGHTAPEIIAARADAAKNNMGLTSFAGAKVRRSDVTIAKNYLDKGEISELNRIVTMFLDYAEDQAKRRKVMHMADWEKKIVDFLEFNDRPVLNDKGRISRPQADAKAYVEYDKYDAHRRAIEAADIDELQENVKTIHSN